MSNVRRLYEILSDGQPHRTDELLLKIYGSDHLGIARISARIFDCKKKYNLDIRSWPDEVKRTLTWYQIVKKEVPKAEPKEFIQPQLLTVRDLE